MQRRADLARFYGAAQAPTAAAAGEYVPGPPHVPPGGPGRTPTASPLTEAFPATRTIAIGGFSKLTPPVAMSTILTGGNAVWYSLIDLDPAEVLGQESSLFAATLSLTSPDSDPSVPGFPSDASRWSDRAGGGAYIVIGDNLPLAGPRSGTRWSVAGCPLPGIADNDSIEDGRPNYFYVAPFPPGCLRDPTPVRVELRPAWAPYVFRQAFGRGRLQVGVAFRSTDVQTAAANLHSMYGLCLVQLHIGLREHPVSYTPTRI